MIRRSIIFSWLILGLGIQGCGATSPKMTFAPIDSVGAVSQSSREAAPPVKERVVARVNGEAIFLADFQERIEQFEDIVPGVKAETQNNSQQELHLIRQQVLDGLIDQALVAQIAQSEGIVISDDTLALSIAEMRQGQTAAQFENWLTINDYTSETFKDALRAQLIAAELYAKITTQMPTTAEQVHARHILLRNSDEAQTILAQLQGGASFVQLAQAYSEDTTSALNGGDLGWFPKGVGIVPPEVEAVAFSLKEGDVISPIVESALGYHIIKVELKAQNRALTPRHRQILQVDFFDQWLAQQRAAARIERYTN